MAECSTSVGGQSATAATVAMTTGSTDLAVRDLFAATEIIAGGGFYSHPALLGGSISRAGNRVLNMEAFGTPLSAVLEAHKRAVAAAAAAATTGGDEAKTTATSPLTPTVIRQVAVQVTEVLRFLHARGICHGAVTLDRIFVDLKGGADGALPQVKLGGLDKVRFTRDLVALAAHGQLPAPTLDSPPEAFGVPLPAGFARPAKDDLFMLGDLWQLGL